MIYFGKSGLLACLALGAGLLQAQSTALLRGVVSDPSGGQVDGARASVFSPVNGLRRETVTADGGAFSLSNLPWQSYELIVEKEGFAVFRREVALRSNIPVELNIRLELAARADQVTVSAYEQVQPVDVEATGTRTALSSEAMEHMPLAIGARGLEAALVSFPGFAQNANGAIHPRGAHNQMTYVIDAMPISDQLTGSFAGSLDPSIVQTLELFPRNV